MMRGAVVQWFLARSKSKTWHREFLKWVHHSLLRIVADVIYLGGVSVLLTKDGRHVTPSVNLLCAVLHVRRHLLIQITVSLL